MVGCVSSPFLREHETEMCGWQLCSWFSLLLCCVVGCMWSVGFSCTFVAPLGSAVFYSFYRFHECGANWSRGVWPSVCVLVSVLVSVKHTFSLEEEDVECLLGSLLWLLSSPCFHSGRGFSDLYARFVYFCLPGYSGWCVSLTHTPHIPHFFLVISRLFALDLVLSFSRVSVVRGVPPSLPFPSSLLSSLLFCLATIKETFPDVLFHSDCECFPPRLQLYGEYREQLGNFARREAARLLTERQWRRQAGDNTTGRRGLGRRHHHQPTLESHHSHGSSTKKPRPYSKCQGDITAVDSWILLSHLKSLRCFTHSDSFCVVLFFCTTQQSILIWYFAHYNFTCNTM